MPEEKEYLKKRYPSEEWDMDLMRAAHQKTMTPVYLTDQEISFFIAMRKAKVFDLRGVDIILHINDDGVLTDIKKPESEAKYNFIFRRKKLSPIDKNYCRR